MTRRYLTPLPKLLSQALSLVLNHSVKYDAKAAHKLTNLSGRVLGIGLESLKIELYCHVIDGRFDIKLATESTVDTWITGTPPALMGMGLAKTKPTRPGAVQIQGDAELAKSYQEFFAELNPDWEEALTQRFGDVVGFRLSKLLVAIRQWLIQAQADIAVMSGDYLKEESRILVTDIELEDFFEDVDDLRDDTDRLQARIQNIHAAIDSTA